MDDQVSSIVHRLSSTQPDTVHWPLPDVPLPQPNHGTIAGGHALYAVEVDMAYLPSDARYERMRYNRCGRSGLKLPAISLGLWHNFGGVDRYENARAMARRAFDLGITHFDLANNYGPPPGSAEETFGQI